MPKWLPMNFLKFFSLFAMNAISIPLPYLRYEESLALEVLRVNPVAFPEFGAEFAQAAIMRDIQAYLLELRAGHVLEERRHRTLVLLFRVSAGGIHQGPARPERIVRAEEHPCLEVGYPPGILRLPALPCPHAAAQGRAGRVEKGLGEPAAPVQPGAVPHRNDAVE